MISSNIAGINIPEHDGERITILYTERYFAPCSLCLYNYLQKYYRGIRCDSALIYSD